MTKLMTSLNFNRGARWLLAPSVALLLTACGGGGGTSGDSAANPQVAGAASSAMTLQMDAATLPDAAAVQLALPTFHAAPVLLAPPDEADAVQNDTSAHWAPRSTQVPSEFSGLSTRRMTVDQLQRVHALGVQALAADGSATPLASGGVVATYTPAQIRTAYGLPVLPALGAVLSATQAAQLGAGQTIYLIDAMHDPNVAAELAAFNQKFGLPSCTTSTIASNVSLPLAAATTSGCTFSVVHNTASGTLTNTTPAYDSGWATEIALDVQWAHATAPLARIILIEAADASLNSLSGAVQLANSLGAGVVSMSFGSPEGSWTSSVDAIFTKANMTYLASTGDSGSGVSWPAVSSHVLAVGGTSLTYSGSGPRSEAVWSGTGGGISQYTATPGYQTSLVPGMGTLAHRSVADVSFNADPNTGQFLAVIAQGSTSVNWMSVGGTSLSTPQWAGLIAVANATRAQSALPVLGAPHAVIYGQIATLSSSYASAFADILKGSDGTCATCSAKVGYDQPTGLGTPNATSLLSALSGAKIAATPPVVTPASIAGNVGTALSFTVSVTATNPVTYALSGAPSGMTIASTGVVTWANPVAGSYAVTVTAKDTKTGLTGQGVYTVSIAAALPPVVGSATITGKPGTPLSFTVTVTDPNPVTFTLGGNPTGMVISSAGVVTWANPVIGSYTVTVIAKDSKTGLSSQGIYTVKIATAGPVITAPAMMGVVGHALTGTISFSDAGASSLSASLSAVPLGMTFTVSGMTLTAHWTSPVLGSYSMKVAAVDSAGLTAQATVAITITAK